MLTFQHLSILASHYEYKVVRATGLNWRKPFSTSFSFFESTQQCSPKELAISVTEHVAKLFSRISVEDILRRTARMSSVGTHWSGQPCLGKLPPVLSQRKTRNSTF
jgi:hypothetical protein